MTCMRIEQSHDKKRGCVHVGVICVRVVCVREWPHLQQVGIADIDLAFIVSNPCARFYPLCFVQHRVMPMIRSLDRRDPFIHIFSFLIVMQAMPWTRLHTGWIPPR